LVGYELRQYLGEHTVFPLDLIELGSRLGRELFDDIFCDVEGLIGKLGVSGNGRFTGKRPIDGFLVGLEKPSTALRWAARKSALTALTRTVSFCTCGESLPRAMTRISPAIRYCTATGTAPIGFHTMFSLRDLHNCAP